MRRRVLVRALAVSLLVWVLTCILSAWWGKLPLFESAVQDVHGAYHVHSQRSDGAGSAASIAAAARAAGISFVVLTDHNVESLSPPEYREGVLLVGAVELSTPSGHLVALGLPRGLTAEEREHDPVGRVASLGGFSILAHPVQNRLAWSDAEAATRADGFELYSGDTLLRRALDRPFSVLLPALFAYPGRASQAIASWVDEDASATNRLLALQKSHPVRVFCGADAHGYPPYRDVFAFMSMHVPVDALSPDAQVASRQVLAGLESGDAYCALDGIAPAPRFRLTGFDAGPRRAFIGSRLTPALPGGTPPRWEWRIHGPAHSTREGVLVADGTGMVHAELWARTPGLFFIPQWRPWIVPAPFEVVPR